MGENIMDKFAINADWIDAPSLDDSAEMERPPNDQFLCNLQIKVDDKLATANISEDAGNRQETTVLSALPLAYWLCDSFWRILYEAGNRHSPSLPHDWRMAHELPAVGEGYAWPSLTFNTNSKSVQITARAQDEESAARQSVRYLVDANAEMDVSEMQASLLDFLDQAATRANTVGDTELPARIDEIRQDLSEKDVREYRIIEAMLGYDPDRAPVKLMEKFCALSRTMRMDNLEEIASGLNPVTGCYLRDQPGILEKTLGAANSGISTKVELKLPEEPARNTPWEYGRKLAQLARSVLNLLPQRIMETEILQECLGLTNPRIAKIQESGRVALCHKKEKILNINFQSPSRSSAIPWFIKKRFQLARVLGAYLVSRNDDDWLAISPSMTWNQQAQRNFACELLAPMEGIREMLPENINRLTGTDVKKIAGHFAVSRQTIVHSMVNQNVITDRQGQELMAFA